MTIEHYRERLADAAFAVLATHGPDQRLDLVPCCFAVDDAVDPSQLVTAVDHKPKRTNRLARLANIDRDPNVTLLIDHRDPDDWSALWWIRAHGRAQVVEAERDRRSAIAALCQKYEHYQERPPEGAVIRIDVERWTAWIQDT